MARGSDPSIGGWLAHPMLVDFLFLFFCRYRSRSFSFRYPLDLGRLRFPLLLGSVQAGVGLLSPSPTSARRVHPPVLLGVAEAAAAIRLASAAASDARRQSVFSGRRLRSRQHRLCPRRDRLQRGLMTLRQLLIGLFSRTVRTRVFVPLWFPFSVQFRLAVGFLFSCGIGSLCGSAPVGHFRL